MTLHGNCLIAGASVSTTGDPFHAVNPATGEILAPAFHPAGSTEADQAMAAAESAFAEYRGSSAADRATFLEEIAKQIEALGDDLIDRACAETGLPAARITGERGRTVGQLRLFASVVREGSWVDARIDTALPEREPLPRPDLRRMLIPLGPVVIFGSSNFPLAFSVAGGDTASAFAAGCPVVVKAHRAHPGTAELIATAINRAVEACKLPSGLFSLVHGDGSLVGIRMVQHPAAKAVGFTGSRVAGRAIFDAAAARPTPIPVFSEMSSLNPVFLLPEALKERGEAIAQGLLGSFTLGVGQFCTKPGLVFAVKGPETDVLLESLATLVKQAPCGTMLTGGIRDAFEENRKIVTGMDGVELVATGDAAASAAHAQTAPSLATTSAANFLAKPELAIEAFGPFTLVIVADSEDELLACAASLEGQLTATVHGTAAELGQSASLLSAIEQKAGRVLLNGFPTGVEVSPAMTHGGPYPATTDARFTSVGTAAILRFARPVTYQTFSDELLPDALKNANPLGIMRLVDGVLTRDPVQA